jgi:hypothetical protein
VTITENATAGLRFESTARRGCRTGGRLLGLNPSAL